jgi:hypothetical protein
MTTLRQIESNRRNALKSTGPKTESGKQRSSRNAVRHGLTAETVIRWLEDPDDYEAFELAVTADYHAETAVERELVLRLASLLWRLRRATSIETGLLQNIVGHSRTQLPAPAAGLRPNHPWTDGSNNCNGIESQADSGATSDSACFQLDVARCFQRLASLDNGAFERLGRYESALWRQTKQTLLTLERLRERTSDNQTSRTQKWWRRPLGHSHEHKW